MPPWMAYLTRGFSSQQPPVHSRDHQQPHKQVGEYILGKTIGRGSSGHVKLGTHKGTGEHVAIKMVPRRHLLSSITIAQSVERELAILQLIHHPHLIQLKQVLQDPTYVYFVTEYADGGELYHMLAGRGRLPEDEAKMLFSQVATALAWCHAHHICHRDLKPENILLDKTHTRVKIADFGMATMQPSPSDLLSTSCGSPHYASPEIVAGKPYYGPATDVWSCGVLLFVLLTGHFPFDDDHVPRLLAKIRSGRRRKLPEHLSPQAKHLVRSMLTHSPAKRITMEQVLQHPWMDIQKQQQPPHRGCDRPILDDPVIANTNMLDGRIWETLKVLWRDMGQQRIIAALMSRGDNVQKLTYQLLQQRTNRVMAEVREEKAPATTAPLPPPTPTPEDATQSKPDMAALLTSHDDLEEMLISRCLSKGTSVSSDDRFSSFSAMRKTHELPPTPTQDTTKINSAASSIVDTEAGSALLLCSDHPMQPCREGETKAPSMRYRWIVAANAASTDNDDDDDEQLHTLIRSAPVPAWASTFAPVYRSDVAAAASSSAPVSLLSTAAQHISPRRNSAPASRQHQQLSSAAAATTSIPDKLPATRVHRWLLDTLFWCEHLYHHCFKGTPYKIHRLECQARREWEAAGKLRQTLHDHFGGRLDKTQNNIWSGSMSTEPPCPQECLAFVCRFQPPGEQSHGTITVIHFVFMTGTPSTIASALHTLTQRMAAYDSQARCVAEANGWTTTRPSANC